MYNFTLGSFQSLVVLYYLICPTSLCYFACPLGSAQCIVVLHYLITCPILFLHVCSVLSSHLWCYYIFPQGGIQFFVRSTVASHIVDYLYTDISLSPGENVANHTLHGKYLGENITFTASFFLECIFNTYGENCNKTCGPANKTRNIFFTCDHDGNVVCFDDYYGDECNVYCKADNSNEDGFYTCDSMGNRVCSESYYGDECKVHCIPTDSDKLGHYTCASDGSRVCLEGYKSGITGESCTECIPTEGCGKSLYNSAL